MPCSEEGRGLLARTKGERGRSLAKGDRAGEVGGNALRVQKVKLGSPARETSWPFEGRRSRVWVTEITQRTLSPLGSPPGLSDSEASYSCGTGQEDMSWCFLSVSSHFRCSTRPIARWVVCSPGDGPCGCRGGTTASWTRPRGRAIHQPCRASVALPSVSH